MKAQDLNGTHLGQPISIRLDEASLTDVLTEISHEADLIDDRKFDGRANWVLGRSHTRLQFMRLGSVRVSPDAIVILC